MLFFFYAV
ncbi:Protein of unknown function [Bacillus mycoides]|nr:Protein of unknown function [Bacillus mycoides]